jgi:hypothetical protein
MKGIDALCPECNTRLQMPPGSAPPPCPGCSRPFPARAPAPGLEERLAGCSVCGGTGFYRQKDFNQNLGCLIFLGGAALAPWTHYLSLVAGTLLDLVLYAVLPTASVCYTCRSVYRGYPRDSSHEPYDPNVAWMHRPREAPWTNS